MPIDPSADAKPEPSQPAVGRAEARGPESGTGAARPSALIADDEEHLRAHLRSKLARLWPDLRIVAEAANGVEALDLLRRHQPDVAFLDIKMPGLSGLEVAREFEAPVAGAPSARATRIVFVTAYDQYALDAFEQEAVDYLVKPVADERLARTIARLRRDGRAEAPPAHLVQLLDRLIGQLPGAGGGALGAAQGGAAASGGPQTEGAPAPLRWIRASLGDTTRHLPVEEVRYFQSDDKYTVVHTAEGEHLIRTPLGELIAQLDGEWFWQIHRSTVVNMRHVAATRRDEGGRLFVQFKGSPIELPVARAYVARFKQM